jgi:hypothetical protein
MEKCCGLMLDRLMDRRGKWLHSLFLEMVLLGLERIVSWRGGLLVKSHFL